MQLQNKTFNKCINFFEQRYKAALVELEETKQKLSSCFKKLNAFEKGTENLDNLLKSRKKNNGRTGFGFKNSTN